jgi:hypothetical protein
LLCPYLLMATRGPQGLLSLRLARIGARDGDAQKPFCYASNSGSVEFCRPHSTTREAGRPSPVILDCTVALLIRTRRRSGGGEAGTIVPPFLLAHRAWPWGASSWPQTAAPGCYKCGDGGGKTRLRNSIAWT